MGHHLSGLVIGSLVILLLPTALGSQSKPDFSLLQGQTWSELAPLENGLPGAPLEKTVLQSQNDQLAINYISGMIYGYTFNYSPGDIARQIADRFELLPRAVIPLPAPRLTLEESITDSEGQLARYSYRSNQAETQQLTIWYSPAIPDSSGTGYSPYEAGPPARQLSFENACKEAVRAYGRTISRNKPRIMNGRLVLVAFPRVGIRSGQWFTDVHIRLIVNNLEEYRSY